MGVIGPGDGTVVGAFTLGAERDETTRMAMIKRAVRTTTVTAARIMPRRGFGVGLTLKRAHSSEQVERASLSKTTPSRVREDQGFLGGAEPCYPTMFCFLAGG